MAKGKVSVWGINYSLLEKNINLSRKYQPVSKYPAVVEDLSLQIPAKILYGQVVDEIKHSSHLIKSVDGPCGLVFARENPLRYPVHYIIFTANMNN